MKYAVDRIEKDLAICQDLETREMLEIKLEILPDGIKDGDIIRKENDVFVFDTEEKKSRIDIIKAKMAKLKRGE